MTITEALKIVIDLADQNAIHEVDADAEFVLIEEMRRQLKAINMIGNLAKALKDTP